MERTKSSTPLSAQMKSRLENEVPESKQIEGNIETMISTGSTLLDLAISGGRVRGGGIPGGILVEVFGPNGSGKTVLLCEIAGAIQRTGGDVMFHDPEGRLNKQFAQMFDLDTDLMKYSMPNLVPEVFAEVRNWKPKGVSRVNGAFTDSLAALSTDLEMEKEEGDKMGMRRAKEFSEELRKTCRILTQKNLIMVCSNQVRENPDAGMFGQKYKAPGGEAIGFYSSIRLRTSSPVKIKKKTKYNETEVERTIGIETTVEVFKNSVWKPYRTAPLTILFDYGIDDIRQNLQFIKKYTSASVYCLGEEKLDASMDKSIRIIERGHAEQELKDQVIDLWMDIEESFESNRKKKTR